MYPNVCCYNHTDVFNASDGIRNTEKTVYEGNSFDFRCCDGVNLPIDASVIQTPNGKFCSFLDESVHEDRRIELLPNQMKCGLNVRVANISDQEVWICKVFARGKKHDQTLLIRKINVTVLHHKDMKCLVQKIHVPKRIPTWLKHQI